MSRSASHYRIVPHRPGHGRLWMMLVVLAWGLSLLATWWLASRQAAPGLAEARARARAGEQALKHERERVAELRQRRPRSNLRPHQPRRQHRGAVLAGRAR
jgi:hypothetical protein